MPGVFLNRMSAARGERRVRQRFEREGEIGGRLKALLRKFLETAADDFFERSRVFPEQGR